MNMAETGNKTICVEGGVKLRGIKLIDAAWKDATSMVVQDEDYRMFMANEGKTSGKGLSQKKVIAKERSEERRRARSYSDAFRSGNLLKENTQQYEGFIPQKRARHRPPKTASASNPTQEDRSSRGVGGRGRGRGKGKRKAKVPVVLAQAEHNTSDSAYDSDSRDTSGNIAQSQQKRKVGRNPPTVTFIWGRVTRCYGCKILFDKSRMDPPHDMVFKMLWKRDMPDGEGGWKQKWFEEPTYYHFEDLACLRNIRSTVEISDLYIQDHTFNSLTAGHIRLLKQNGYWDSLLINRALKAQGLYQ
jgi:hypothetical protein